MTRRPLAALALLAAAALVGTALAAQEEDPAKAARDAEAAAAKAGAALFRDEALGTNERSCSTCHDNPKKPELSLRGVTTRFPRYDEDAGRVITLQEKFVQMQERSLKARKTLPLGDPKWTALELHLRGLK